MNIEAILLAQNPWWLNPHSRVAIHYPVRRDLHSTVLTQVHNQTDRRAIMVAGPRQVGKTILLLQLADDLIQAGWPAMNLTYFDFSDDRLIGSPPEPRRVAEFDPVGTIKEIPRILLLDEISRAPRWAAWLKQAVDRSSDRIVVTDSAASLLRDQSRESGLGRWDEYRMEGLSFPEFLRLQGEGEASDAILRRLPNPLERYLEAGGFPEHARKDSFAEAHRRLRTDVVDRAIMRDLTMFVKDVEKAKALFVYLVQDSGAIFDSKARARDLNVDARSVQSWVRLLEETRLIIPLSRRSSQPSARLRSKPRIYAADHGLVVSFAPSPDPLREPRIRGAVFEATVFRHLRDAAATLRGEISYFRQRDDLELDFVLDLPGGTIAVEVTSSTDPTRKLGKLSKAAHAVRADHVLLIHGGPLDSRRAEVWIVPLLQFLLAPLAFLQEGRSR